MNKELDQLLQEYLAKLENNIKYLKRKILDLDAYEEFKIMIDIITIDISLIQKRQEVMSQESLSTMSKLKKLKKSYKLEEIIAKEYVVND